jgi:hypothetical protein
MATRPVAPEGAVVRSETLRLLDVFQIVVLMILKFGFVRGRKLGSTGGAPDGRGGRGRHARGNGTRYYTPPPEIRGKGLRVAAGSSSPDLAEHTDYRDETDD